jgi:hypothetical protein
MGRHGRRTGFFGWVDHAATASFGFFWALPRQAVSDAEWSIAVVLNTAISVVQHSRFSP